MDARMRLDRRHGRRTVADHDHFGVRLGVLEHVGDRASEPFLVTGRDEDGERGHRCSTQDGDLSPRRMSGVSPRPVAYACTASITP